MKIVKNYVVALTCFAGLINHDAEHPLRVQVVARDSIEAGRNALSDARALGWKRRRIMWVQEGSLTK